jgi:hypothetical protein
MFKQFVLYHRSIIISIAVIVLIACFAGMYLVPKVYGFSGSFFYPIVYFYGTPLAIIVPLAAFAILAWQFIPATSNILKIISITMLMVPCSFLLFGVAIYYFGFVSYSPLPSHFNRISFEDHVYYLAWDTTPTSDLEYAHDRYFVYRCDNSGIICEYNNIDSTIGAYRWSSILSGQRTVGFLVEDNQLYVQINEERFRVATAG